MYFANGVEHRDQSFESSKDHRRKSFFVFQGCDRNCKITKLYSPIVEDRKVASILSDSTTVAATFSSLYSVSEDMMVDVTLFDGRLVNHDKRKG